MSKKANYSYVGISFVILVFGIIFIPRIIDKISKEGIVSKEGKSRNVNNKETQVYKEEADLEFLNINGKPKKVPEFSFTNQNGKTITNTDYLGKVYVVEFFFTVCPSICPKMNKNLVKIQNTFSEYKDFGVASFSINPEYDTPKILKEYAEHYGITNSNWHLMTGDKATIFELANVGFTIYAGQDENVEGGFEHSGNFALIDKNGFIRSRKDDFGNPIVYYKGIISEEEKIDEDGIKEEISILKEDIAKLLKE